MLMRVLKRAGIFCLFVVMVVSAAFFYSGRLPAAVEAFKEELQVDRISRQLFEAYNVMNGSLHFELPDSWYAHEVPMLGGEVLYHLDFISQDKRIHGFVQVWKLAKPLEQLIAESEKAATGVVDFKGYNVKEIKVDGRKGYVMDYSRANQDGEYNKAYEVFIKGASNKMYRLSFFVPEKEWRNYYKLLFERIIRTVRISE